MLRPRAGSEENIDSSELTRFCGSGCAGFSGVTIKSDRPFDSPRVFKSEQTSSKRFHHEVKLMNLADLNAELKAWLMSAYELSG